MNLLLHIVYAAHAKGTHHKLALDALRHLKSAQAERWQHLFLANAELYLDGSKAPDTAFKDFKNHVLHPREGYWGGAPEQARSWYQHLTDALAQGDWQTAVYCAGVLSHYYTDPLQPLHTGQSEAENNIHRALEWSISRAYGELHALGEAEFASPDVVIPSGDNWLAELICAGAEMSNRYYEKLLAHYNIARGVVDPPAGLDRVAKRIVAERLRYAYVSYAAVLDRAIAEAAVAPPEVSLTVPTLLAAAQIPIKVFARRMANREEQRLIERMYDELIATGTVEQHLPEDDRTLRDLHAQEIRSKLQPLQPSQVFPFKPREPAVARSVLGRTVSGGGRARERIAIAKDNVVALRTQAHATPAASEPAQRQVPALKGIPVREPTRTGDETNRAPAASQIALASVASAMPHASERWAAVTVAPLRAHDAAPRGCTRSCCPGAALPSYTRSGRGRRPRHWPHDRRAPLSSGHPDGARSPESRASRARRARRCPPHHAPGNSRLAGSGAVGLRGAGAARHARPAARRRRLSLSRRRRCGRSRRVVCRRSRLRHLHGGPTSPAQRRPTRHRKDQGLAGRCPEHYGSLKLTAVVLAPESNTPTRSPLAGT